MKEKVHKGMQSGLKPKRLLPEKLKKYWPLYMMLIPGLVLLIVFAYVPMTGLILAFKEYRLGDGMFAGEWVGFKYFIKLFSDPSSKQVLWNTIKISVLNIVVGTPISLILALMLNEVGNKYFKTAVQTVSYLPHFISWVVLAGIIIRLLSPSTGVVAKLLEMVTGQEGIFLLSDPTKITSVLVITNQYKGMGWGTLVYMAALSGMDTEQYEAAIIDGASRLKRMLYITLPSLATLIVTLLIMSSANILNAGFDQIYNLQNDMTRKVTEVIDTYVYKVGLKDMQFSFSIAVGMFKSVVGLVLMVIVHWFTKNVLKTESGIW